jgi:hypothetical protein
VFNAGGNIAPDLGKIVCSLHRSKTPRYFLLYLALVLSGRRAKKPIHDGSQKNELNGYKPNTRAINKKHLIDNNSQLA